MSEGIFIELLDSDAVKLELVEDTTDLEVAAESGDLVELLVGSTPTVHSLETREFVEVSEQGPTGLPGSASEVGPFIFVQAVPAATWTVTHNRGTKPEVTVFLDSAPDERVWPDISYPNLSTVVIQLDSAESGKAYIP